MIIKYYKYIEYGIMIIIKDVTGHNMIWYMLMIIIIIINKIIIIINYEFNNNDNI